MKLPKHIAATLEHNPHRIDYKTVAEWSADGADDAETGWLDWVSAEQRAQAIEHNDVWVLRWYPETPIGFCCFAAHNLDILLARAMLNE